jgi:uncharacterized protein
MKRILTLDGGGIRGVFSLAILLRMQELLRAHTGSPNLVLADHFDFFAGTSTGAIIATCLCWGMSVEEVLGFYTEHGKTIFTSAPWYRPFKRFLKSRYEAKPLSELLQRTFSEDDDGKVPALLNTKRLKALLLVVVRNHTTGSAWPITNNPEAMYNRPNLPDCNLNVPLWKLVRASTAAPVYFDPEVITLGQSTQVFVDGSITPYNNPALIAALTAILPPYRIAWEPGVDKIRVISIGTIRFASSELQTKAAQMWLGYNLPRIPNALMDGIGLEQDYICRCLGQCIYGEDIDSEIRNLIDLSLPGRNWFSYVRYNKVFSGQELQSMSHEAFQVTKMDAVKTIPYLHEIGREYAAQHVRLEHLI